MADRMVVIRSMIGGTISVVKPQYGVNRVWRKAGQPLTIPYDTVEQLLYDIGFSNMLKNGILYIDSLQDKIDLGLEPADAKEPVNIIVLTQEQIKDMLTKTPIDVFKRKIAELTKVQVDNIISYAILNEVVDAEKCRFLKELTGKDILKAIAQKQEVEEAEKRERMGGAVEGRR